MKKYITIILVAILALFISNIPTSAKEMDLQELGNKAIELKKDTEYIYVIGKYAFTSEHQLRQEDIMLAAGSIVADAKDLEAALQKMNIQKVIPKYDKKFNIIGWENGENLVGKTKLPTEEKFDIRYIDYNFLAEKSDASINLDIFNGDTYKTYTDILKEKLKFDAKESYSSGKLTYKSGKLSGLLLQNDKITLKPEDKEKYQNTPYYFAYVLEVPNATDKTKITTSGMGRTGEIKWENFDVQTGKTPGIAILVPIIKTEWEKDKTYSITIDLDGETSTDGKTGSEYEPTTYKLDLSELTFQKDSNATLNDNEEEISETDKNTLKEWGYTLTGENKHYNLETNGSENSYKLTGKVEEQHLKEGTFNPNAEDGYFFVFNLKKPEELTKVPDGVKVTVEGEQKLTYGKEYFNDKGVFTEIFKLKNNCKDNCTIKVKVDWDGESGDKYLESKEITIDYKDLIFVKNSKFSVSALTDKENKLQSSFGWEKPSDYNVQFGSNETGVKVTGLLPIFNGNGEKLPFKDNHITGYYIAFDIKTNIDAIDNTTVEIIDGEETISWKKKDFDSTDTIYILKHLHIDAKDKTFKIIVDMDGDGEEYAPYTITVDYSSLIFQDYSIGEISIDKLTADDLKDDTPEREELNSYKFNDKTIEDVVINAGKLSGSVKQQTIDSSAGFDEQEGYFVPVKINIPKEYKDNLIFILNDGKGGTFNYLPKENEKAQGWVMVLFKLKEEADEISYQIDFDGAGKEYLPQKYTIDYNDLEFQTENKITFEYFDAKKGKIETKEEIVYQGETIDSSIAPTVDTYSYHNFDYWYESDKDSNIGFAFGTESTEKDEDITLRAHWTLDADKFIEDVVEDLDAGSTDYSSDFNDKFDITKEGNIITIDVKDTEYKLEEMDSTSIPGTIAYILQKGEIEEIKLGTKEKQVIFTKTGANNEVIAKTALDEEGNALKEKIKAGAKTLFSDNEVYGEGAGDKTINAMAVAKNEFTITIGNLSDTVKLKNDANKEYTFKFKTNTAIVKSEEDLKQALNNTDITTIDIKDSFSITSKQEINRPMTIKSSLTDAPTLTGSSSDEIFNVTSRNVNFENLKLTGSKVAIVVNDVATVIAKKVDFTGISEEGVLVNGNGSFTGSELTYSDEKYMKPLVKASNEAKVDVTRSGNIKAPKTTLKKVNKYSGDFNEIAVADTLVDDTEQSSYKHYFLNADVENRWLEITFVADRTITLAPRSYTMLYDKETEGDYIIEPENMGVITEYSDNIATFKVSSWSNNGKSYQKGQIPVPKTNASYTAEYTVTYNEGKVTEVSDETQLKEAINNATTEKKYIVVKNEIDLEEVLTINKTVSLVGTESGKDNITGSIKGQIIIAADGVLFDEIKIVGKKIESSSNNHVITVQNKSFRSDKSEYSVEGEGLDSIIYYEKDEPSTTLYFNKFSSKVGTYIKFGSTVDGTLDSDTNQRGSSIVGNVFSDKEGTKTFITVGKIKEGTSFQVNQSDLDLSASKDATLVKVTGLEPSEAASLQVSSIYFINKDNNKVYVEIDSMDKDDVSGLTIKTFKSTEAKFDIKYTSDITSPDKKVKIAYLDKD